MIDFVLSESFAPLVRLLLVALLPYTIIRIFCKWVDSLSFEKHYFVKVKVVSKHVKRGAYLYGHTVMYDHRVVVCLEGKEYEVKSEHLYYDSDDYVFVTVEYAVNKKGKRRVWSISG